MRKVEFANDEVYHLYNRGVEKRRVFTTERDYRRFILGLVEFNDEECVLPSNVRFGLRQPSTAQCLETKSLNEQGGQEKKQSSRARKILVEILAFCLMPNHFHLLVRQRRENGVTRFMHKLGVGYTMYFNLKYKRVGSLFQGTFKAVHVTQESHFQYLPTYIHANPLDLSQPRWRVQDVKNPQEALRTLEQYPWSSYRDYVGQKGFPDVTHRDLLTSVLGGPPEYAQFVRQWLTAMDRVSAIQEVIIE